MSKSRSQLKIFFQVRTAYLSGSAGASGEEGVALATVRSGMLAQAAQDAVQQKGRS